MDTRGQKEKSAQEMVVYNIQQTEGHSRRGGEGGTLMKRKRGDDWCRNWKRSLTVECQGSLDADSKS